MPSSRVSSCIAGGFFTGWATREAQLGKMEGTQLYACMLSLFNHVLLFATIWTVTLQASLSMEFSRQEYWSGLPCPSPGDLPSPGIKLGSSALQADSVLLSHQGSPWEKYILCILIIIYLDKDGKRNQRNVKGYFWVIHIIYERYVPILYVCW